VYDLFGDPEESLHQIGGDSFYENNNGLIYIPDFISIEESINLISYIENQPWSSELNRRVQHYGYRYDYKSRSLDNLSEVLEIEKFFLGFLDILTYELNELGLKTRPNQIIVNEYEVGQGITWHIDSEKSFDDNIFIISLLSDCVMKLEHKKTKELIEVFLKKNSLLCLTKESRYDWRHTIPSTKSFMFKGKRVMRARRLSLTCRYIKNPLK
jgi:alkylated DNA repair dioxygenase AlkB